MSSEQFSEKPLAASVALTCPTCGAVAPSINAVACWMCGESFTFVEESAQQGGQSGPSAAPPRQDAWSEIYGWSAFGVLAVILCIGLAVSAPGLLIPLAILGLPVVTVYAVAHRKGGPAAPNDMPRASQSAATTAENRPRAPLPQRGAWDAAYGCLMFLGGLGFAALVAVIAFIAFIAHVCSAPIGR